MQFLDAIGLAYFWEKIKDWANSLFFSKEGGEISPDRGLHYIINGEQLDVSISGNENETIHIFNVDEDGIEAISIKKSGGTATQVLMADGSVRTLNTSNGIAGLDANGNIPLANLGNLDTTVAEVVTALPTSNIKRHIYLVKDSDTANNKYAEYVYTGDISAAYDSTKWEKLGDFRATVDLANYAKKSDAVEFHTIRWSSEIIDNTQTVRKTKQYITFQNLLGEATKISFEDTTINMAGFMSIEDKKKLNTIDYNANHYILPYAADGTLGGIRLGYKKQDIGNGVAYPLIVDGNAKAHVIILNANPSAKGLMSETDKAKLDGIAPNANNYSLPLAANGTRGGIQVGYAANGRNYPVQLSGEKAYVNVPWTDTNTTYDLSPYAKTADVNAALAKKVDKVSGKGLSTEDFTAALKTKLNGIATGATADSAIPTSVIDALN